MLEQKQKKIMSGQELTNRLAFLVAAIEACAVHLCGEEARKGRAVLLFLPSKPKDSDARLYNNMVFHRYYREKLADAREVEERARARRAETVQLIEGKLAETSRAKEALSLAKQAYFDEGGSAGESSEAAVTAAEAYLNALEAELAQLRAAQQRAQASLKAATARVNAATSKLVELDNERAGKKLSSFCELACAIRAEHGLSESSLDPHDPRAFDDVIGLGAPCAEADNTFVSRAATDDSNASILNHFIICNQVVAPAFAAEGICACRDSFIRDTDPSFAFEIIAAARARIGKLIASPELACGDYPTRQSVEALAQALLGKDAPTLRPAEINIVYQIASSNAFPVMVEEQLKIGLLEALARFGGHDAQGEFTRKLNVLSYNEQLAREAHARALEGAGENATMRYIELLAARAEILSFMLSCALLGAEGVDAFEVNMARLQNIVTKAPAFSRRRANEGAAQARAVLIEQIPNVEGGVSLGRTWNLDQARPTLVGRAPYDTALDHIVVPAGHAPAPGFVDFASAVSRAHALVEFDGERWMVSDAGSAYGTAVLGPADGRATGRMLVDDERCPLRSGDVLALSPIEFEDGSVTCDLHFGFSYRFEVTG